MRTRPTRSGRYLPPWRHSEPPGVAVAGPPTAIVAFDFGTPGLPDLTDTTLILGVKFVPSEAVSCTGVEWFVPATAPGSACIFTLWTAGGGKLASKSADVTSSAGTLARVLFDAPVALSAATSYLASVWTPDRYVGTTSYAWPKTDGRLTAPADNGWFAQWPEDTFPTVQSGNAANYHVSPVIAA